MGHIRHETVEEPMTKILRRKFLKMTAATAAAAKLGGIASHRIYDDLAQGLAELGHEVFYQLGEVTQPLPQP